MCRARICSVYMPTSRVQSKTENTIFPPLKIREKVTYSKSTTQIKRKWTDNSQFTQRSKINSLQEIRGKDCSPLLISVSITCDGWRSLRTFSMQELSTNKYVATGTWFTCNRNLGKQKTNISDHYTFWQIPVGWKKTTGTHVLSSEIPLQSALPMMACTVIRLYLNIVKTGSAVNHHQTSPSVVRNQVGNVQLLWPLFTTNPFPRLSGRGSKEHLMQGWTGSLQSSQISPVKSVRHSQICFLHLLKKKKN